MCCGHSVARGPAQVTRAAACSAASDGKNTVAYVLVHVQSQHVSGLQRLATVLLSASRSPLTRMQALTCSYLLKSSARHVLHAGCAFVEFRKWAQAERAMEAHNGVTRLPGSEMPLVVKFADAKRPESGYPPPGGGHMGPRHGSWGALHPGMHPGAFHGMPPQVGCILVHVKVATVACCHASNSNSLRYWGHDVPRGCGDGAL